jgi:hypothetical protein
MFCVFLKDTREEQVYHAFLSLERDGGEWFHPHSSHHIPEATFPGIHWIKGRMGPRAGLDGVTNTKSVLPLEIEPHQ